MYIYSDPADANDPHKLPNVEIFYIEKNNNSEDDLDEGFYYWPCFPNCLPDGMMDGPFPTLEAAVAAAQEE